MINFYPINISYVKDQASVENKYTLNENTQGSNPCYVEVPVIYRSTSGSEVNLILYAKPYVYLTRSGSDIYLVHFGFEVRFKENYKLKYGIGKVRGSSGEISTTCHLNSTFMSCSINIKELNDLTYYNYSIFLDYNPTGLGIKIGSISENFTGYIRVPADKIDFDVFYPDHDASGTSTLINEIINDTYNIYFSYASGSTPTPTEKQFYATYYAGDNSTVIASGYVKMAGNTADRWYDTVLTGPVDGGGDGTYGLGYSGSPQQTKEGGGQTAGSNYYVNYFLDSNMNQRVANSSTVRGGPGTTEYRHKMSGSHYYWSRNSSGASPSPDYVFENGQQYSLYPYFETISTGGQLPTLPASFPSATRAGYRNEDGSKNNNAYYCNGVRVFPGSQVTESMVSSGNNINLYLVWTPVKYTIRFNKGNADGWYSNVNTIVSVTKTYGTDIATSASNYPKQNSRLVKNGYLQYGWVAGGSKSYSSGDGAICTYSYSGDYAFSKAPITDRWYNDNMSGVDVYPSWYPINHKVLAHYYVNTTGEDLLDTYNFNIDSNQLSVYLPQKLTNKKDTWEFIGWVQNTKPKGDGWEWGASGSDIRNKGVFRDLSDLGSTKYSNTYGVNSKSLTTEDWDNVNKNIDIYAIWSVSSRWVYISHAWVPTMGMWIYKDNEWHQVDELSIRNSGWKKEVID